jgi:hypothetical protein
MDSEVWQNRAVRHLTDTEIGAIMKDPRTEIIEWAALGLTWLLNRARLGIVRCGAMGGDVFDIHGGWLYPNDIAFMLDRQEIVVVSTNVVRFNPN